MCLAIPGKVERIFEANNTLMGSVNFGGIVKDVCLAYLPDIRIGDYAIVHVGFAITRVDEEAAHKTLALFRELGMLDREFGEEEKEDSYEVPH